MENLRKRTMGGNGMSGAVVSGSEAEALDVVFSSNDGSELVIIRGEENWPNEGYTPIGIVVVPGTHNRYGDGTCGVMSLVIMDYNNPTTGYPYGAGEGVSYGMFWGERDSANAVGNNIFTSEMALSHDITSGDYIQAQNLDKTSMDTTMASSRLVWPYAGTGTKPTGDASTVYSNDGTYPYVSATTGLAGCDFNGIRNTAAIYVYTTTHPYYNYLNSWESAHVYNSGDACSAPAGICCGRFKTLGTRSFVEVYSGITSNSLNYGTPDSTKDNTGFWYFPAEGELSYLPRHYYDIRQVTLSLYQKYGIVCHLLHGNMWSSTQVNPFMAWYMDFGKYTLHISYRVKDDYEYVVRAFMRI